MVEIRPATAEDVADKVALERRLFAEDSGTHGYRTIAHSTRHPVRYGVLRSLYVMPSHRRAGVGRDLSERFVTWARDTGCVEVHVDHFAGNERAGRLYESLGFAPRSLNRVLPLTDE